MKAIFFMIGIMLGIFAFCGARILSLFIPNVIKGIRLSKELRYLFWKHFICVYITRKIKINGTVYKFWLSEDNEFFSNKFKGRWCLNIWQMENKRDFSGNTWCYFDINNKKENEKSLTKVKEILINGF